MCGKATPNKFSVSCSLPASVYCQLLHILYRFSKLYLVKLSTHLLVYDRVSTNSCLYYSCNIKDQGTS